MVALRRITAETIDLLREKVTAEFGSTSAIVGPIRQILSSNMLGIGKTTSFECDVEAESQPKRPFWSGRLSRDRTIDLIADDAGDALENEDLDTDLLSSDAPATPVKASQQFFREALAQLEEELSTSLTPHSSSPKISRKRRDRVPVLATQPGNIIIIVGVGSDAITIVHLLSAYYGSSKICTAGELATGVDSLVDRRSALAARQAATDDGRFILVAFGITPGRDYTEQLQMLDATQVWAAVDASRKTDDTRVWVALLDEAADVDALAVVGTTATLTPSSVNELGVPIGWLEDEPASEPTLSADAAGIVIE